MKLRAKNPYLLAEAKLGGLWGTRLHYWVVNPVTAGEPRQMRMYFGVRSLDNRYDTGLYFDRTADTLELLGQFAKMSRQWDNCLALRIRCDTTREDRAYDEEVKILSVEAFDDPEAVEAWRKLRTIRPAIGLETRPVEIVRTRLVPVVGAGPETVTTTNSAFFDELQWEFVRKAVESLVALNDPRRPDR